MTMPPRKPADPRPGAARARGPLGRVAWLIVVTAAIVGLAFLVGRARTGGESVAVSYTDVKGRKTPGLQVILSRGGEVRPMQPGTRVRAGDALRFVVRTGQPRHLVVRTRDASGAEWILFPPEAGGPEAPLVRPGEELPGAFVLDAAPGRATVTAQFSAQPFRTDQPLPTDAEIVTVSLEKER
jgi:hypothetical protein